eukprot:SAG22_NODE_1011_length_6041_cov_11.536856_6_plen_137_part_00
MGGARGEGRGGRGGGGAVATESEDTEVLAYGGTHLLLQHIFVYRQPMCTPPAPREPIRSWVGDHQASHHGQLQLVYIAQGAAGCCQCTRGNACKNSKRGRVLYSRKRRQEFEVCLLQVVPALLCCRRGADARGLGA